MKTLFQNATFITASDTWTADMLVDGEHIALIGQNLPGDDAQQVDCSGLYLLPGGVDPHVHLALPMFDTISSDDHYTGHKAAAFGGTTTALDFTAQAKGGSLRASIDEWHAKAAGKAAIDYSFHVNITDYTPAVAAEIPGLVDEGLTTVKMFTAYNNVLRIADGDIFRVMLTAAEHGILPLMHCENGDVIEHLVAQALAAGNTAPIWHARTRPAWGETEATLRVVGLAATANTPLYVVHNTCAGAVDSIRYGRERGLQVMGETCPQYLFFTEEYLQRPDGAKWICSPPLRTAADNAALWQALANGDIQAIGTDHCPFFYDGTTPIDYEGRPVAIPGKELGAHDFTKIPNGLPAIEHRLTLLWTFGVNTARISPNRFVALTSTNPARIMGLYPRKGSLTVGADADLLLWDPHKQHTISAAGSHMRTDYDLWEGTTLTGVPVQVYLRGRKIVDGEQWLGQPGQGQFIPRSTFTAVL